MDPRFQEADVSEVLVVPYTEITNWCCCSCSSDMLSECVLKFGANSDDMGCVCDCGFVYVSE